jgi:transcriptional regulator with XRE-family HTH domain
MNRREFGQLISTLRQELGWTQFQLAEIAQLDEAVISQIERGVKKFFEPELLMNLANALQLTTLERREFFLAANGLENSQMVRQAANGVATDTSHPARLLQKLFDIMQEIRFPSFLCDVYGDVIAANAAIVKFFNVPSAILETAGQIPAGYNTMRLTFSGEMIARTHVADNWDDYAMTSMLSYRAVTLRYRADPYFKYLLKTFRDPLKYPFFERFWKRVSSLEQDKNMNTDVFDYRHEIYGRIKYITTGITTLTSFGELFLTKYLPLDDHTSEIFESLFKEAGNQVLRLASWPEKKII